MKKKHFIGLLLASVIAASSLFTACGPNSAGNDENTVEVYAYNGGWGLDWLTAAEKKFEDANPGIDVVIKQQDILGGIADQVKSGPRANSVDLYWASEDIFELLLKGSDVLSGYNMVFEPLDEVYDYKPSGDKTVREKCSPGMLDAVTFETEENGETVSHEYVLHLGNGTAGIIYNSKKFEELGITVPRTTDELYDVTCKEINEKHSDGGNKTKAAFSESVSTAYSQYMMYVWWAQYETVEGVKDFWNGKYTKNGLPKTGNGIFEQKGRLYALEAYEKMIGDYVGEGEKAYPRNAHSKINSMKYIQAQEQLMNGNCLMMVNGNWLENEMSLRSNGSASNVELKMMKAPIISKIIEKTNSIKDDETLRKVVSYVDGEGEKPDGVTDEDIAVIRKARQVKYSNYSGGTFIPAYATAKENAKKFMKYLCSEEYAQIYFEKTGGNYVSFNRDLTNFSSASAFMKSVAENEGTTECPNGYRYPLAGLGGMLVFPGTVDIPSLLAAKNANDRKTPQAIFDYGVTIGTNEYFRECLEKAGLN